MQTQWISVPSEDGQAFDAYLALPPSGSGPGLLLLQEIFGVNAHIRAVAEQYALAGYVVLAPDVFWRQARRADLGYEGADYDQAIALMRGLDPELAQADLRAATRALRGRSEVGGRKVAAMGYCMGGRLAYQAAAQGSVDAAVAYYGGGIHGQLDLAQRISCPMLFHYAGIDSNIPAAAVEQVKAAFAGKPATFFWYEGAHHGFNCWMRGAYHPPSAALALGRTLTFLAEQLF
ncbi:MAG: dienelactone hydrolase family protein [Burkholderiales bacterium]